MRAYLSHHSKMSFVCFLQYFDFHQIVKQGALTLKTLASNNQYNKEVMSRLGMIGSLRRLVLGLLQASYCSRPLSTLST